MQRFTYTLYAIAPHYTKEPHESIYSAEQASLAGRSYAVMGPKLSLKGCSRTYMFNRVAKLRTCNWPGIPALPQLNIHALKNTRTSLLRATGSKYSGERRRGETPSSWISSPRQLLSSWLASIAFRKYSPSVNMGKPRESIPPAIQRCELCMHYRVCGQTWPTNPLPSTRWKIFTLLATAPRHQHNDVDVLLSLSCSRLTWYQGYTNLA